MAFFNQIGAGGFQPKRKFRFLVVFPKLTNLTFMAKAAAKPSYDMSPSEHNVLNHVFKFPGIVKWEDVDITLIDAVDPNTGSKFWNALRNSGYVTPGSESALTHGVTKVGAHAALGNVKIQQLDGGGVLVPTDAGTAPIGTASPVIVDEWVLNNCFIKSVKWGELAYDSEDLIEINVSLVYDFATYAPNAGTYNG
tara:strand:- start:4193 stop:4777 length:585 start_codon:yes stop_codon:yes gene_type:complete